MAKNKSPEVQPDEATAVTEAAINATPLSNSATPSEGVGDTADAPETALAVLTRDLPTEIVERLMSLVERMDPDKPGLEEMGDTRWAPPIIRIHQGMTTSAPQNSKPGCLYTDVGDVLAAPFEFVPIYMHQGNVKFTKETGGDGESNSQSCRSDDGELSQRGRPCSECPDRPFREDKITACSKVIAVYVLDKEFRNIYKIEFAKTSYRAGAKLFKQVSAGSTLWERVFSLGMTQETNVKVAGNPKFYVFAVTPTGERTDEKYLRLAKFLYEKILEARMKMKEAAKARLAKLKEQFDGSTFGGGHSDIPAADGVDGSGSSNMTNM